MKISLLLFLLMGLCIVGPGRAHANKVTAGKSSAVRPAKTSTSTKTRDRNRRTRSRVTGSRLRRSQAAQAARDTVNYLMWELTAGAGSRFRIDVRSLMTPGITDGSRLLKPLKTTVHRDGSTTWRYDLLTPDDEWSSSAGTSNKSEPHQVQVKTTITVTKATSRRRKYHIPRRSQAPDLA